MNKVKDLLQNCLWEINNVKGCKTKNSLHKGTIIRLGSKLFKVV